MFIIANIFHNADLSTFLWTSLGLLAGFWNFFYPFQLSKLDEKQLIQISPRFEGIKKQYIANLALWAFLVAVVVLVTQDAWSIRTYGAKFYPKMGICFALLGVLQASFALAKGIYPQAASPAFVYGDEKKIRRVAFVQIMISVMVILLSVSVFIFFTSSLS